VLAPSHPPGGARTPGSGTWLTRLAPAIVAAVAVLVYANSLANGFAFDDVHIIQNNPRVHNLSGLRDILFTPYWPQFGAELGLYRPFVILLYAVQWAMGGGSAIVFHAVSLALHAGVSLLVFLLLARLTSRAAAFPGALIFAVHPVHSEAVANIVGQAELITALLLFAACLVHSTRSPGTHIPLRRRLVLALLFALAVFTKESGVVLPGLLVAVDLAQRRVPLSFRGLIGYARALLPLLFLLTATLALYLAIRFEVLSGFLIGMDAAPALPYLSEEYRLLNAFRAFPEFLRLLFVPLELSADYAPGVLLPVQSLTPMTVLGLVLLASLAVLACVTPWWPSAGFPAAWFLISIATVSNLFFPIGVLVAERTLYVPSFALSAMIAYAWHYVAARRATRSPQERRPTALAPALLVIVVILFGIRTWVRSPDWASTPAVVSALFRDHPESYRAQWMHAEELFRLGRMDEAHAHFTLAHRLYPRDAQFLMSFATFLSTTNRTDRALELLRQAQELQPSILRPARMLTHGYLVAGRYDDALRTLDDAVNRELHSFAFHPLRAYAYHGLGDHARAVASWRAALDDPRGVTWATMAYLARGLAVAGRTADAAATASAALELVDDDVGRQRVGQLRDAIRGGCYRGLDGDAGAFVMPPCDPLGDWFMAVGQSVVPSALHPATAATPAAGAAAPMPVPLP
jgi:protein O-mannosyl-transferase